MIIDRLPFLYKSTDQLRVGFDAGMSPNVCDAAGRLHRIASGPEQTSR